MGNNSKISTQSLLETAAGKPIRPVFSTSQLKPATGSQLHDAPAQVKLLDLDYQTTTYTLTASAGTYTNVVWPACGFPGLTSDSKGTFSSGNVPVSSTVPQYFSNAIIVSSNTQLFLACFVEYYSPVTNIFMGQVSLQTTGFTNSMKVALKGPWFVGGTSYNAFSCVPSSVIYAVTSQSSVPISLGITAMLYSLYI